MRNEHNLTRSTKMRAMTKSVRELLDPDHIRMSIVANEPPVDDDISRKKRRITFNEQVAVREIEQALDYTEDEVAQTWYSRSEYRVMRLDMVSTVRQMMSGKYTGDTEQYCARGLEYRTPGSARGLKLRRMDSLVSVLDEQIKQLIRTGSVDYDVLAQSYSRCSENCKYEATRRGELDAEESSRVLTGKDSITTLICNAIVRREEQYLKSLFVGGSNTKARRECLFNDSSRHGM